MLFFGVARDEAKFAERVYLRVLVRALATLEQFVLIGLAAIVHGVVRVFAVVRVRHAALVTPTRIVLLNLRISSSFSVL